MGDTFYTRHLLQQRAPYDITTYLPDYNMEHHWYGTFYNYE